MELEQAQARDWLMFGYGVAGFYDERPDALAALMREAMRGEQDEVRRQAGETTARLGRVARLSLRLGRSARALAKSGVAIILLKVSVQTLKSASLTFGPM